jgi:iron complex transport system substrate-binding protein
VEGAVEKIRSVAVALGEEERGEQLAATMTARLGEIESDVATMTDHPRVLFLYARQGMGAPMIGGTGSGADIMIELAGGVNAGAEIQGFSPLTPEALLDVRPDVVLMLDKGYDAIGGETGLLTLPGMAETPAGQAKRFVTVSDDLLLGFGARLPEAVETLAARIHESEAAAGE